MEKLSKMRKIIETLRFPIEIPIHSYLRDHQYAGRAVIPAVESCHILANNIKNHFSDINHLFIYNASFNKFLDIKPEQNIIQAFNDIEFYEDGIIISKLLTKTKAPKSGITRTYEHANLQFSKHDQLFREPTYDIASALDGICLKISSQEIYKDLVMFGPSFRNVTGNLFVTQNGVVANIFAAPHGPTENLPLGSPFVFDAALHAACIWGQKYYNIIAFPTGFERRIILKPTVPGEKYFARIIPVRADPTNLIFDIWIYDNEGNMREAGLGVKIKDVSNGKMKPPEWIKNINNHLLNNISSKCEALSVIEIDMILDFAHKALSNDELLRLEPMKEKRRKSYISARLACKFLSRKLSKEENVLPANEITTIFDKIYPACPLPDGSSPYECSVSHDNRFAIAVASRKRIGVDVEELSERILKPQHIYMNDQEKIIVNKDKEISKTELNEIESCLRIWTIKEAVTKALKIGLSESWKLVQVKTIGKNISTFLINTIEINAYHDTVDNHLFTIVEFD